MTTFTYTDLMSMDLAKLHTALGDWKAMVAELTKLETAARNGLLRKSEAAQWKGVNADVTREFVRGTAKEFADLRTEASSIHAVLEDAHSELESIQKRAKSLTEDAANGSEKDPGLLVTDAGSGTVRVMEAMCTPEGTTQRTKDLMQWYADTITGLIAHASEVDVAVTRALKRTHGGDPHNAGHARYTSLDEDQLPRAVKLASLGKDANDTQRDELRRLWRSLSPEARAELWTNQKDKLLAAGLLNPTVKQIAPDRGAGPYNVEEPGFEEWYTRAKMRTIQEGADAAGLVDAARHMDHYLDDNKGEPIVLPVDKMLSENEGFRAHMEDHIRRSQDDWRDMALAEFKANGGRPVAIPVETANQRDYEFRQGDDLNWFYAVGSTRANVTGVVTVVPDAAGQPQVGLDYQVNAWDRYNWDQGKGVDIYGMGVPDGQMARLHTTGLAQEFDMSGSSSVKHYDLGSAASNPEPLPEPDDPGREGGRTDNGREAREGRGGTGR
ncbi:hypothetical protein ACFC0D_04705 [Streptomyces sp. NPDC056222]|uniref:hypothetical protein n=1 Tax=Streptomyces sp. NPDC056222 TaxID=3345749 RepID=UPI0035DAEEB4